MKITTIMNFGVIIFFLSLTSVTFVYAQNAGPFDAVRQQLNSKDPREAYRAMKQMVRGKIDAKPYAADLTYWISKHIRTFDAAYIDKVAQGILANLDVLALPVLRERYESNPDDRRAILYTFAEMRSGWKQSMDLILKSARAKSSEERGAAIYALWRIAPSYPKAISEFVNALGAQDRFVRLNAGTGLEKSNLSRTSLINLLSGSTNLTEQQKTIVDEAKASPIGRDALIMSLKNHCPPDPVAAEKMVTDLVAKGHWVEFSLGGCPHFQIWFESNIDSIAESDRLRSLSILMTAATIRKLRNFYFARRGYIFKDEKLGDFYSRFDWYKPKTTDAAQIKLNQSSVETIAFLKRIEMQMSTRKVAQGANSEKAIHMTYGPYKVRRSKSTHNDPEGENGTSWELQFPSGARRIFESESVSKYKTPSYLSDVVFNHIPKSDKLLVCEIWHARHYDSWWVEKMLLFDQRGQVLKVKQGGPTGISECPEMSSWNRELLFTVEYVGEGGSDDYNFVTYDLDLNQIGHQYMGASGYSHQGVPGNDGYYFYGDDIVWGSRAEHDAWFRVDENGQISPVAERILNGVETVTNDSWRTHDPVTKILWEGSTYQYQSIMKVAEHFSGRLYIYGEGNSNSWNYVVPIGKKIVADQKSFEKQSVSEGKIGKYH